MARRYKVLGVVFGLLVVGLSVLGYRMSHDAPCGPAQPLPAGAQGMQAIVYRCYGSTEVLKLEQVAKPELADDRVLIKVHAASVNPLDWHYMRGKPYIMRLSSGMGTPADSRLGVDFAGTVEAVGRNVKRYKPGDEVFGGASGAFAEYVSMADHRSLALKPANMSFEQAAAVPIAAVTALQALRDKGLIRAGQKVLINGASGGVGTFAVQIAKSYGADVTGVCSTRNLQMVSSIGADRVIDYTRENFTAGTQRYDLIIDTVSNHSLSALRQVLTPEGTLVIVGGAGDGNWIGPLIGPLQALLVSKFVDQKLEPMLAELRPADMTILADLMRAGKLTPVIDRRYPLSEVPAAIAYLETGRARGKVVIDVVPPTIDR